MKKILHTKVTVKTLIKSISKNTAVISRATPHKVHKLEIKHD